ncbi:MAG TPA: septal ring lytic transglycosylase RlpA family protein [Polyangiaceae bacterium]|nr:septal ring lytic transglycosylase RlpA family protein [Polyangiaceae bacterium]HNZ23082.1 septal ring lytic transglycosylase RlpA family protein [Polyangiaceae bacterium]HOD21140.1 septal ring lytic transglycosylase RlpA family protein [Polyangiaceae bacterium]HOE48909.1 septal ring lytic transglycosylase RlpA family protein [Polyangiaceae bacterium]HOH02146.1 septal ring lytic transglycosylase RlpA family protein [Polyangiaceae bacterium]
MPSRFGHDAPAPTLSLLTRSAYPFALPFSHTLAPHKFGWPLLVLVSLSPACQPRTPQPPVTRVTFPSYPPPPPTAANSPQPSSNPLDSQSFPPYPPPPPQPFEPKPKAPYSEGDALRQSFAGRPPKRSWSGEATYYHDSLTGNLTASGDQYDPTRYTAAHRSLPFGTILRIVHPNSGRDVFVCVNDRGPFGRRSLLVDLSRAAAEELGLLRHGVMTVRTDVMEYGTGRKGACNRGKNH